VDVIRTLNTHKIHISLYLVSTLSAHANIKLKKINVARISTKVLIKKCLTMGLLQGVLVSPWPNPEGNKLQRQKILSSIYPIYYHNWRNISTIYIYITRLASKEIFSPSNKIHREVGWAKDLSVPLFLDQRNNPQHDLMVFQVPKSHSPLRQDE
jgi:hypothetical protein